MVSLKLQDEVLFERNFSLLHPFYTELKNVLGTSEREHLLLGLNLLRLLVQNRISDFHVELEKLSPEAHASSVVQKVVDIEQALLEGAYKQILEAREHVPDETFGYFMDLLIETIREEIASSCEAAYDSLSLAGAQKLLMLQSEADLKSFLEKRDWKVVGGSFVFQRKDEGEAAIPSMETIQRMLAYARELERIV